MLQAESKTQQGLSTPTIPTTPLSNNISGEIKAEITEQDNKKFSEQVQENREVSPSLSSQDIQAATPSFSTPATPIDWSSYPYNLGGAEGNRFAGRYTLENRANKVKERVLGCGTSNELIGWLSPRQTFTSHFHCQGYFFWGMA